MGISRNNHDVIIVIRQHDGAPQVHLVDLRIDGRWEDGCKEGEESLAAVQIERLEHLDSGRDELSGDGDNGKLRKGGGDVGCVDANTLDGDIK